MSATMYQTGSSSTPSKFGIKFIHDFIMNGFDYKLSDETLHKITDLTSQVGSPTYVRTPIFQKTERTEKTDIQTSTPASTSTTTHTPTTYLFNNFKKNKRNKAVEVVNDEEWNSIKTNNLISTKKENNQSSVDKDISLIRVQLNKLTDKNYIDICGKIFNIIDNLIENSITEEDMNKMIEVIFDIASTNRFYSKIYADLCSELSLKYDIMLQIIKLNIDKFMTLFSNIEYVDPKENYDEFCKITKMNEKRKALATFYVNLVKNAIIEKQIVIDIIIDIFSKIINFMAIDDKKNEVDELTDIFAILYSKQLCQDIDFTINSKTMPELIQQISQSKTKDFKSLTNKTLFKFMDLVDV